MKNFMKIFIGLIICLSLFSCNKEIEKTYYSQTLEINISNATFTKTVFKEDPVTDENNIVRLVVGVFDKNTNLAKFVKEVSGNITNGNVSFNVPKLQNGDSVFCVMNATAGAYSGVTTRQEFLSKTMTIDQALTDTHENLSVKSIPMFGSSVIKTQDGKYVAVMVATHLTSKITLKKVTKDFDVNGVYANATMQLKDVFLLNVPDKMNICSSPYPTTYSTYYHGCYTYTIPNEFQKCYLGNNNIEYPLYFYTMPNNSPRNTKLVLHYSFDADGPSGTIQAKDTYYPININPTGCGDLTPKWVCPNRNYIISIIIKGIGVNSPLDEIENGKLNITFAISSFVGTDQTTTIE